MGQTYCNACCFNDKMNAFDYQVSEFKRKNNNPTPLQSFAVKVKQVIQLNHTVKQTYATFRSPHFAQRIGTKAEFYYYLFNYAAYYEGQWANGLPHGQGKLIYDDGSLYEGCFDQGYANCRQAIYIYSNGSYYRGNVKNNKANGQGQLKTQKFNYKGNWLNDLPHGKGKQFYSQNSHYDGDFIEGKKQGNGIYYWNNKQYYTGQFINNQMDGDGYLSLKDYTYRGRFRKGIKEGLGVLINIKNNWKYQGEFLNNRMNGKGKYTWPDGTMFEGRFLNDERTNEGFMILTDGVVIDCGLSQIS